MNKRMAAIAAIVQQGTIPADIGTDHAQLPILLVENGTCRKVYACDVRSGPLQMAKANIAAHHLEDRIEILLADGFSGVPDDCNAAIIAGMGYRTAIGILEKAEKRLPFLRQIIVQVNDDVPGFRRWISDRKYTIREELLIHDGGKDYTAVVFDTEPHVSYSPEEILVGPVLARKNTAEFRMYCAERADKLEKISELRGRTEAEEDGLPEKIAILRKFAKKNER